MHELEFKTKIEDVDIYGINNFLGTSKDCDVDTGFHKHKKIFINQNKTTNKMENKTLTTTLTTEGFEIIGIDRLFPNIGEGMVADLSTMTVEWQPIIVFDGTEVFLEKINIIKASLTVYIVDFNDSGKKTHASTHYVLLDEVQFDTKKIVFSDGGVSLKIIHAEYDYCKNTITFE